MMGADDRAPRTVTSSPPEEYPVLLPQDALQPAVCAEAVRAHGATNLIVAWPQQLLGYWLNAYFPQGLFRFRRTLSRRDQVVAGLERQGVAITEERLWAVPEDCALPLLYAGKHRPGLYFDPHWRRQQALFAEHVAKTELEQGLGNLWSDIRSGRFAEIAAGYDGAAGDYTMLTLQLADDVRA
jgi:hypothetical protein